MDGWWLKNPFYIRYMVRESTALFVAAYALYLLCGLARLAGGEAAWQGWLHELSSPVAIVFHIIAMIAALYHTVTWFKVSPKVTPPLFIGQNRISDKTITTSQYVIAGVLYLLLFILAWGA
jgi:fumarate reductase subunit C